MVLGAVAAASRDATAQGDHRWGGLLFDVFAREASGGGVEAWTAEDGGRIRHIDPSLTDWVFQDVPDEVQDTLHRVFFLPGSSTGWAVGKGGWVLKTTNGGATWSALGSRIAAQGDGDSPDPYEELFDIHFIDGSDGWMIGLHSIWSTDDGGQSWDDLGDPFDPVVNDFYDLSLDFVELYSLDVLVRGDGSRLGLISGQPGIVLRSTDANLASWEVAWDVAHLCDDAPCGGSGSPIAACACDICPGGPEHLGPWFEAWGIAIGSDEQNPLAVLVGGVGGQCGMVFASTDDGVTWGPEHHECTCSGSGCQDCTSLAAYNDDPQNPFDLHRHQFFRTLYDVDVHEDNSAHGAGYNGQIIVRDPSTSVWLDRSIYAAGVPTVPGSVTFPLIGAGTAATSSGDMLLVSGEGGHLLSSTDDGDTWDVEAIGEPHRIADVFFKDVNTGWHVGQFFRIARTDNGGGEWIEQIPTSAPVTGTFHSVVFATTTDMPGVAVGDPVPSGSASESMSVPKIRYTDAILQQSSEWVEEDVEFQGYGTEFVNSWLDGKALKRVTWVGGDEFWAVGDEGLILKSTNAGQLWRIVLPELASTLYDFEMEGVAFVLNSTTGLIVGRRPVSGTPQGVAYQYKDTGGTVTWTSLTMPSGLTVDGLYDVAISGSTAWFVGEQIVSGAKEGVVLSSELDGSGNFGSLSDFTPFQGIPACVTGGDLIGVPVLLEVEVAPNTGAVWAGGACGRLWSRSSGGTWTQVKSATDAHILGLTFVAEGSSARGWVGGFRATQTQQCITSVQ